ncbi:long-chain fatty acid--CoA ligase, partial [bacterium]
IPVRNFVTRKILEQAGLSSIRVMIAGGAALKPEVEEGIRALGIGIVQGYGLSEASPVVTINPPDRPKIGSIGLPLPETEVRIHNPDQDGIGELIVKGEHVMQGYYNNPEATAETIMDGWLHTGDLGYMDEDGYFYITGRKKAVIVTPGGKNVFPEELEYKLQQIDIVEEVLVIGVFDSEKKGDEIMAIIYPDWELLPECTGDDRTACAREKLEGLIKELNAELPPYKRIKYIEVREEEFPKTTTRKIKRYLFQNVKKI